MEDEVKRSVPLSTLNYGIASFSMDLHFNGQQPKMSTKFVKIGKVSSLYFYPLKSCKGISISEANCTEYGIDYDRQWAILDHGGRMVTMRSKEALAHVAPSFEGGKIKVEAPGMQPLFLPLEINEPEAQVIDIELFGLSGSAVLVGKEADNWFTDYLGKPHSLVTFSKTLCKPRSLSEHKVHGSRKCTTEKEKVAFADGCPYLLISENSLKEVNRHCAKFECIMQRFRPNIVVTGCEAFAEDGWKDLKIGPTGFRCLHRCGRCTLPNVDPETGIRDKQEPLKTLRSFRLVPKEDDPSYGNAPTLGRNLGIEVCGSIRVGDDIFASF